MEVRQGLEEWDEDAVKPSRKGIGNRAFSWLSISTMISDPDCRWEARKQNYIRCVLMCSVSAAITMNKVYHEYQLHTRCFYLSIKACERNSSKRDDGMSVFLTMAQQGQIPSIFDLDLG
jgi:hypothetical protein